MIDFESLPEVKIPLDELLPQKRTMQLIDKARGTAAGTVASETTLGERHALFALPDGTFGSWILLELMAQTIGIYAGLKNRAEGSGPRIGFILGTRHFDARVPLFRPGDTIRVSAECLADFESELPSQFECVAFCGGIEVGRSKLTVYQPKDLSAFSHGI
jgi:predicted hotdog family 3-hydroxylacyl-ACP dehydratase